MPIEFKVKTVACYRGRSRTTDHTASIHFRFRGHTLCFLAILLVCACAPPSESVLYFMSDACVLAVKRLPFSITIKDRVKCVCSTHRKRKSGTHTHTLSRGCVPHAHTRSTRNHSWCKNGNVCSTFKRNWLREIHVRRVDARVNVRMLTTVNVGRSRLVLFVCSSQIPRRVYTAKCVYLSVVYIRGAWAFPPVSHPRCDDGLSSYTVRPGCVRKRLSCHNILSRIIIRVYGRGERQLAKYFHARTMLGKSIAPRRASQTWEAL